MNYEEIVCDANNLYRAYKVSVKSSKWKESTQRFMMNLYINDTVREMPLDTYLKSRMILSTGHFKMDQHRNLSCMKEAE